MDARQARELSEKALEETVISPWIERIDARIKEACSKGIRCIVDPDVYYQGSKFVESATGPEYKRIKAYYLSLGFDWIEHKNPDPGNPCSREYTELTW